MPESSLSGFVFDLYWHLDLEVENTFTQKVKRDQASRTLYTLKWFLEEMYNI